MPAGWLVPALQVGAALIGAKASGDAAKASQRGTDLKKLRKEAEAAGFNPLTVLRATGGQGFNKGSSGALASASFWSSFANSAGQIAGQFDPQIKADKALERLQRIADIDNTRMNTRYSAKLLSEMGKEVDGPKTVPLFDEEGNHVTKGDGTKVYLDPKSQEVFDKYIMVRDPVTNEIYAMPNPDLADMGKEELTTFFATQPLFQGAARSGRSFQLELGGLSFGFPRDPHDFSRGITMPKSNNAQKAYTY
jgi:hypothetical protein